ncbi:MAG: hypothetical protein AB1505_07710 [Candidatus Latescibacterota bacterium]
MSDQVPEHGGESALVQAVAHRAAERALAAFMALAARHHATKEARGKRPPSSATATTVEAP